MEPAGDFSFLLFLLLCKCSCSYAPLMWDFVWHPVQVRTDTVVFNLMDDGEYWNHRPFSRRFFFLFESYADALAFVHRNACWQSRCFTEYALLPHVFELTLRESHFGFSRHVIFPTWPLWHVKNQLDFLTGLHSYTNYLDITKIIQSLHFFKV